MKKIAIVILSVLLIFSLFGCSLLYDHEICAVGFFDVGYSKALNDAFIGTYNWDGTNEGMNIVIPEYYNNIKIKGLGGVFGRGVPTYFKIYPNEEARNILCPNATEWSHINATVWSYISDTNNIIVNTVQYLRFTIHISKYIQDIEGLNLGGIITAEFVEEETIKYNVYVLTCYVTCDEDNNMFYAKDGKLYFRENDMIVEGIDYEDFDLESLNMECKDRIGFNSPFA